MTITFPLTLPVAPGFNQFKLLRMPVVGVTASPYTGAQEVQVWPGQWWEAEVGLPSMTRAQIGAWRAFFAKLNGRAGTFLMGDPNFKAPLGSAAATPGTPVVDGAHSAMDAVLSIGGAPLSASGYLLAGDFIQLGTGASSRLHMVLNDVDTDGSGDADIDIWPRLRDDYAGGETVTLNNCKGVFRLRDNQTDDTARPKPFFDTGFACIEALD